MKNLKLRLPEIAEKNSIRDFLLIWASFGTTGSREKETRSYWKPLKDLHSSGFSRKLVPSDYEARDMNPFWRLMTWKNIHRQGENIYNSLFTDSNWTVIEKYSRIKEPCFNETWEFCKKLSAWGTTPKEDRLSNPVAKVFTAHVCHPGKIPILDKFVYRSWLILTEKEETVKKDIRKPMKREELRDFLTDIQEWNQDFWNQKSINSEIYPMASDNEKGLYRTIDRALWIFGDFLWKFQDQIEMC